MSDGQLKRRSLIIPWWIFQWALQSDSFRRHVVVETGEKLPFVLPTDFSRFSSLLSGKASSKFAKLAIIKTSK